jgi:hypothetical protein
LITLDHFVAAITGFPARPKLLSIIAWQRRQLDQIVDQPFPHSTFKVFHGMWACLRKQYAFQIVDPPQIGKRVHNYAVRRFKPLRAF